MESKKSPVLTLCSKLPFRSKVYLFFLLLENDGSGRQGSSRNVEEGDLKATRVKREVHRDST